MHLVAAGLVLLRDEAGAVALIETFRPVEGSSNATTFEVADVPNVDIEIEISEAIIACARSNPNRVLPLLLRITNYDNDWAARLAESTVMDLCESNHDPDSAERIILEVGSLVDLLHSPVAMTAFTNELCERKNLTKLLQYVERIADPGTRVLVHSFVARELRSNGDAIGAQNQLEIATTLSDSLSASVLNWILHDLLMAWQSVLGRELTASNLQRLIESRGVGPPNGLRETVVCEALAVNGSWDRAVDVLARSGVNSDERLFELALLAGIEGTALRRLSFESPAYSALAQFLADNAKCNQTLLDFSWVDVSSRSVVSFFVSAMVLSLIAQDIGNAIDFGKAFRTMQSASSSIYISYVDLVCMVLDELLRSRRMESAVRFLENEVDVEAAFFGSVYLIRAIREGRWDGEFH